MYESSSVFKPKSSEEINKRLKRFSQLELNRILLNPLRLVNLSIVEFLLNAGANIEAKDYNGCTPLMLASYYGRENIVKILLNNGANIEAKSNKG